MHGESVAYSFGTIGQSVAAHPGFRNQQVAAKAMQSRRGTGGGALGGENEDANAVEDSTEGRRISEAMMDYWVAFLRTGKPHAENLPVWPASALTCLKRWCSATPVWKPKDFAFNENTRRFPSHHRGLRCRHCIERGICHVLIAVDLVLGRIRVPRHRCRCRRAPGYPNGRGARSSPAPENCGGPGPGKSAWRTLKVGPEERDSSSIFPTRAMGSPPPWFSRCTAARPAAGWRCI